MHCVSLRRNRPRGQVMVIAVMALTVLTAAAIALSSVARLELRAAERGVDRVRREASLRGLVAQGIALLEQTRRDPDALLELLEDYGTLRWRPFPPAASDGEEAPKPALEAALQLQDASACLNVNTAGREELERLPGMSEALVEAILTWREPPSRRDPGRTPGPRSYEVKHRPFDTLEELLLLPGLDRERTARLLFGAPTVAETRDLRTPPLTELLTAFSGEHNADGDGNPRADVNTADAEELRAAANRYGTLLSPEQARSLVTVRQSRPSPFGSVAEALQAAGVPFHHWGVLLDAWTVDRRSFLTGRINVNTAPEWVLRSIPDLSSEQTDRILEARREPGRRALSWSDLLELLAGTRTAAEGENGGAGNEQEQRQREATARLERRLAVRSAVFRARGLVREPGSRRIDAVSALVLLPPSPEEPAQVVQWRQPDRFPGWTAWFRPAEKEERIRER